MSPASCPARAWPEPFTSVEAGVVERGALAWSGKCRPCSFARPGFVLGEHSGGVGILGVEVQPPLDRSPLMLLGHTTMMEKKEPHL